MRATPRPAASPRRDLAEPLLGLEQGDEHGRGSGIEVMGLAEPGAKGRRAVGQSRAASARNAATRKASSAESAWRSLDQRGRFGSPADERAMTVSPSSRRNSSARPSSTNRSPAASRSA